MTTPEEVLKLAKANGVKIVDFKFVDLPGTWQHFSVPAHVLTEEVFEEGMPFDGSSVRGFQTIDESDMLVLPDATTAFIDPFTAVPTLSLICNIAYPTKQPYTRDPRYIAQKAEEFLRASGIAETAYLDQKPNFTFSTMFAIILPTIPNMPKLTQLRPTGIVLAMMVSPT